MQLASRFAANTPVLRSELPLSDDQIRAVAPSIFAEDKHASRSERYAYIPTASVLSELRKEGFQPFMVCQTRVRDEGKREHTKHMLRLRHAGQINGAEANEIILLNSHDGTYYIIGLVSYVAKGAERVGLPLSAESTAASRFRSLHLLCGYHYVGCTSEHCATKPAFAFVGLPAISRAATSS